MIRVLLVDDHASFRESLAFLLGREPDLTVVGEAGSLAEARRLLGARVDVVVVDLDLPDGDGAALIKELRAANPGGMTLVLTGSGRRTDLARVVEAGAAGALHKSVGATEVVNAIRRLAAGEQLLSREEVLGMLRLAGQRQAADQEAQARLATLTERERAVLQGLAEGLSDKELAVQLHVSPKTVQFHMTNILQKLGVDSRLQALVIAVRHGAAEIN